MALPIDDLPHPVPGIASLRWKENWLFVVMAPEQSCYALCHVNTEPGFDRARFTFTAIVDGKRFTYMNERAFQGIAPFDRRLEDGSVRVDFVEPGQRFHLRIDIPDLTAEFAFTATHATFDFAACRAIAPHHVSFREQMTLGTNLSHDHHQQALAVTGSLTIAGGSTRAISGVGYRDHSYCMRGDSLIATHSWCGLLFDDMVIGVKTCEMMGRRGVEAREGYVDGTNGPQVLTGIAVEVKRWDDGYADVLFKLESVAGEQYVIAADLRRSIAVMPFVSEKPGSRPGYGIVEHLCPIVERGSGRTGLGHIELGRNDALVEQPATS